jgi:hypothetical protein
LHTGFLNLQLHGGIAFHGAYFSAGCLAPIEYTNGN